MSAFAQEPNNNPFSVESVPGWVNPIAAPDKTPSTTHSSREGEHYLLLDQQENAVIDETYSHVVKEITSENGVQNGSKVQFQYEPAYQKLSVHFVRIIRDGKILDRLEPEKFKVIQQEPGLERHLFMGELSAVLFLEDVRIGDIIEYACTTTGSNPILGGHFVSSFLAQWSTPMDRQSFRLLWPSGKELHIKNHKTTAQPEIRKLGELTEYDWNLFDIPTSVYEDGTPSWVESFGWVQLSDFSNWGEVAQWAMPLYQHKRGELPAELRAKIAVWQYHATSDEQVARALRFVQDDVRYLGIEIGANSQQPNRPELVFNRRFGDCKDKVSLFCSILDEMGIQARPVFVHSYFRKTVEDWCPSPYDFNHVVAQVKLNGKVLWLDPTLSYQRGPLTNIFFPDYGCGLVIAPETTELTQIPTQTAGEPLTSIYDTFRVFSYTNPAAYEVRITRRGVDADELRAVLAETSREALEKSQLNYFARLYPKIKTSAPLEVRDDEKKNEITLYLNYRISDIWELSENKRKWTLDLHAGEIFNMAREPQTSLRTLPILVLHPMHRKQVTSFNFIGPASFKNETIKFEDQAVRFERQAAFSQGKLTISYDCATRTNMVPVAEASEYLATLKRIREKCYYEVERPVFDPTHVQYQPNWPVLALASVFSVLMLPAMFLAYHFRPNSAQPPQLQSDRALTGLAGWLILVAISLGFRIVFTIIQIFKLLWACSLEKWQLLTIPGSTAYNPNWGPILIFELFANLAFLAFAILLLILYFQKRFALPRYIIGFLIATVVFILIDNAWLVAIKPATVIKSIVPMVLGVGIWVWYFLVSRRVKLTFIC
ncbi:MAG TPA: DUF3857 domain-containing protein [Verrucomicrobiae bacterium]|nr:DUF3857 domain-containing protein [Verrucomicrobiae bacterium]